MVAALLVKSSYMNLGGIFRPIEGQKCGGRPCYQSKETTSLYFLEGCGWVFGRQVGSEAGIYHQVASEAQTPLEIDASAWGPNIQDIVEAPAIDADSAPSQISVKSTFVNLSGLYNKVTGHEAGGRPSYSKKDGTSLYYLLGTNAWIFGRDLGSNSGVFLHVSSDAFLPTEINAVAWGEHIEQVTAVKEVAPGSEGGAPPRLAVKSPYGNLSGVFKIQLGKESETGKPSYQNKSGTWLFYLEPLMSWVFGPELGDSSFYLQVQSDAATPIDLPDGAWGNGTEVSVSKEADKPGVAPAQVAVDSPYDNICGVFTLVADYDDGCGHPGYTNADGSTSLYYMEGSGWVLGPELGGDAFFMQAESEAALPTEIEEGAWGEDVEGIHAVAEVDHQALHDCPQRIGFDIQADNLAGGYVRGEDFEGYPTYFNEEKEVYLWHKMAAREWVLTDCPPGDNSGHYMCWESTELDPTDPPLEQDGGAFYEITWAEMEDHPEMFVDPDFPPEQKSFGIDKESEGGIQWIRSLELDRQHKPVLWDTIEPNDLMQSSVGDCWLLAALSSMAVFPEKIQELFKTGDQVQTDGKYVIRLYSVAAGTWNDVVVDDFFPCKPRKWYEKVAVPLCTNPNHNELWVMLLEKAFAKFVGSYDNLQGGNASWAWQAMTGCEKCILYAKLPDGRWGEFENDLNKQKEDGNFKPQIQFSGGRGYLTQDEVFEKIEQNEKEQFLMACAINSNSGENIRDDGLVEGHEYALTSVADNMLGNGVRLLKLVNPWGNRFEWNGHWSDQSNDWEGHEQLRRIMNPTRKRGSRGSADGVFCMSYEDFFNIYSLVRVCPLHMRANNPSCKKNEEKNAPERVKKIFRQWDSSGNGEITQDELTAIFSLLNPEFDSVFCEKLFNQIDSNHNGKIDYCEFVDWLLDDDVGANLECCFW